METGEVRCRWSGHRCRCVKCVVQNTHVVTQKVQGPLARKGGDGSSKFREQFTANSYDNLLRRTLSGSLGRGVGAAGFGVPPIGQGAPAQPLAAFPQHKYRHPRAPFPSCLSHIPSIFAPGTFSPWSVSLARSLSCRLRVSVSVIPRSDLDPHQAAGQQLLRSLQLQCRPPCREHLIQRSRSLVPLGSSSLA